jgi:hypothetical protein
MRILGPTFLALTAGACVPLLGAVTLPAVSYAQTFNKCVAGKNKCVSTKVKALLKCHETAEKKGLNPATDPKMLRCLQKAKEKFDGAASPRRGVSRRWRQRRSQRNRRPSVPRRTTPLRWKRRWMPSSRAW